MNDLTERNYIRQAPALVNGRYSLTKSEGDLVYALLTAINKEDEDFKDYTFTKAQLEAKLAIKLDTVQLRATAKSLMSKILEISRDAEDWELLSWFSYFAYKNGIIKCRFDKAMKPYLLELKQFVLADIRQIIQMQSEYSRRIYMLLKERAKFGTRSFKVDELMDTLEVPKSYKRYSQFKDKVLNQAVKDINKYTDLEIKNIGTNKKPVFFEEEKIIRKVDTVTFHFKKNLGDLKSFIEYIRELHTNEALYHSRDGRLIKCSKKGLLYYADKIDEWINEKDALKIWEWLHENKPKLFIFQANLIDYAQGADNE